MKLPDPRPAGEVLQELLDARYWSQSDLAEIVGRPLQAVNEIIRGKKEITRQTALQFGAAFGTMPDYWLNIQDNYLLWKLSQTETHQRKLAGIRERARMERKPRGKAGSSGGDTQTLHQHLA